MIGRAQRTGAYPSRREAAPIKPNKPGRNDRWICGSMRKWKQRRGVQRAE